MLKWTILFLLISITWRRRSPCITGSIRTREKSLVEQNYRLADDQNALDRRMDSLESRTHSKFTAMQDATSKMQSQLGSMMNALG